MIKKVIIFIVYFIVILFATTTVEAEESDIDTGNTCTSESMATFNELASDIKVNYEFDEILVDTAEDEDSWYTKYDLKLIIYNFSDQMQGFIEATDTHDAVYLSSDRKNKDGNIVIEIEDTTEVQNLNILFYADALGCDYKLREITITLPRYNYYSTYAICDDIPEYYLCQKYVTYYIDGETFVDDVTNYKKKMASQKESTEIDFGEDNNTIINQTVSFFSKYKYVFLVIIIWIGVTLTFIILRKKKGGIK